MDTSNLTSINKKLNIHASTSLWILLYCFIKYNWSKRILLGIFKWQGMYQVNGKVMKFGYQTKLNLKIQVCRILVIFYVSIFHFPTTTSFSFSCLSTPFLFNTRFFINIIFFLRLQAFFGLWSKTHIRKWLNFLEKLHIFRIQIWGLIHHLSQILVIQCYYLSLQIL